MFIVLFILLLFLPMFNAEYFQNEFDNNELLMQRSAAASYLFGRYQNRLLDLPINSLSFVVPSDIDDHQRAKRIYWENLAFHATDYNKKTKKPA